MKLLQEEAPEAFEQVTRAFFQRFCSEDLKLPRRLVTAVASISQDAPFQKLEATDLLLLTDPIEMCELVSEWIQSDACDARLGDITAAFVRIESAMDAILQANCIPLAVGGDGSVSLPQMRALHRKHGSFALLHFDAHTDTWPVPDAGRHSNANQFTFANTEALVDMQAALHIGTRGPVNASRNIRYAESLGYRVIPFTDYRGLGPAGLLSVIHETVGSRPVFVCYDMDFFDPSVAPGVATPTPGGAMPEEGLELMRGLQGLNVIGIDINTMTPLHDAGGVTATLAASLLAESLAVLSSRL